MSAACDTIPHQAHPVSTVVFFGRRVKNLEAGLTAEFPAPPSPKLRLACCSLYHAYSVPSEGGSGGGDKAYGLDKFIPIKSSAATGSGAPESYAGHSRVPSPDRGHLLS